MNNVFILFCLAQSIQHDATGIHLLTIVSEFGSFDCHVTWFSYLSLRDFRIIELGNVCLYV